MPKRAEAPDDELELEDGGEAVVKIVEPVMIEARVLREIASWADWGQVG